MAEKLYVGTPVDCNAVRSALDFAMGMPVPGTVNGVPIVNEETRQAMFASWWAMPQASRDAIIASPVAPLDRLDAAMEQPGDRNVSRDSACLLGT